MNNKIKLIIGILIFALIIAGAYIAYDNLSKDYGSDNTLATNAPAITNSQTPRPAETTVSAENDENTLQKAPDFTVYDKNGNSVKLSDYLGKPVILNFWASWCPPCKMEMPDFDAVCKETGNEYQFMMVNLTDGGRETVETAQSFIESQGYDFPVFFDTDIDAAMKYNTYSIPATYFIDADGYLTAYAQGAIDAQTLRSGMDMIK